MKERACKECKRITKLDVCINCKSPTSRDWLGYVSIIDTNNSEVSRKLKIDSTGKFALRVK
jgi:DNA-directed RNA polymerase subunit E"|tara:strand:+ start:1350 stop:1532 length:183 start_codon:yes stop_codon:yes gene_type:complete